MCGLWLSDNLIWSHKKLFHHLLFNFKPQRKTVPYLIWFNVGAIDLSNVRSFSLDSEWLKFPENFSVDDVYTWRSRPLSAVYIYIHRWHHWKCCGQFLPFVLLFPIWSKQNCTLLFSTMLDPKRFHLNVISFLLGLRIQSHLQVMPSGVKKATHFRKETKICKIHSFIPIAFHIPKYLAEGSGRCVCLCTVYIDSNSRSSNWFQL